MDLLRIISCLMVIFAHADAGWKYQPVDSIHWKTAIGYECFFRGCVLVFFMLSGALSRSTNVKKAAKKALVFVVVFWITSFLYSINDAVLGLTRGNAISFSEILDKTINYKYHLWFLPAFIFLVFVSPFINRLFNSDKGRIAIKCYLVIWIVFGIILRTVQLATMDISKFAMIDKYVSGMTFTPILSENPIGFYCLGRILAEKKRSDRTNKLLFLGWFLASILIGALTYIYSSLAGELDSRFIHDTTILIFMQTIGTFCYGTALEIGPKPAGLIEKIVPYALGIYLIHPFFIDWLYRVKVFGETSIFGLNIHPVIQAPLRLVIVFALSYATVYLVKSVKSSLTHTGKQ